MKWIPIDKAKVKFGQEYLVFHTGGTPSVGTLSESKVTASGIAHTFQVQIQAEPVPATHIAIITEPNGTGS